MVHSRDKKEIKEYRKNAKIIPNIRHLENLYARLLNKFYDFQG